MHRFTDPERHMLCTSLQRPSTLAVIQGLHLTQACHSPSANIMLAEPRVAVTSCLCESLSSLGYLGAPQALAAPPHATARLGTTCVAST